MIKFRVIFLTFLLMAKATLASEPHFVTGFNQGWINNDYAYQWDKKFSKEEMEFLISSTKKGGGTVLRMWLFEGSRMIDKLPPETLKNVEETLILANKYQVKIYFTFFDANALKAINKTEEKRNFYWNLFNDKYQMGEKFLDDVVSPLLNLFNDYRNNVYAIDLVNEINFMANPIYMRSIFKSGWDGANLFVKKWRNYIRKRATIPVTASLGHAFAVQSLLKKNLDHDAVDFFDIHLYNNNGSIPKCEELSKVKKDVILGEYGQFSKKYDDALQKKTVKNFMINAKKCGLKGALAWRLKDQRPGHNKEARFSFHAFGSFRPAFFLHRDLSIELQ